MTDMDDAFNEIYRSILNDHLEVSKPLVLAALRKAKADGMREAAAILNRSRYGNFGDYKNILLAADKIEKGSPNG